MGHPSPLPGGTQVEIVVLARGARVIHEVPVDWTDSADSRVNILVTALGDLRGICRLRWGLLTGSLRVPALGGARPMLLDHTIGGSAR